MSQKARRGSCRPGQRIQHAILLAQLFDEMYPQVTAKGMIALADRLLDLVIELGDWKMASNNAQLRTIAFGLPIPRQQHVQLIDLGTR
jgi:hypothetical protein